MSSDCNDDRTSAPLHGCTPIRTSNDVSHYDVSPLRSLSATTNDSMAAANPTVPDATKHAVATVADTVTY